MEALILGKGRDLPKGLERENRIIQTIMRQLLFALDGLHSTGIVHRDIKPQNIIFSEGSTIQHECTCKACLICFFPAKFFTFDCLFETGSQTFKIIDLGAAADLRVGINYIPNEFLLDPR